MNRFDRVTSILLLLQTRSVVTAQFLSEQFDVSERTIYRDIRTLENAGVPIGSEAGMGYFLEPGYHLPPVSFSQDEAAALLLGEKLLTSALDDQSLKDYQQALNKVRAVMDRADKDQLTSFDADTAALPSGSQFPQSDSADDKWLRECRSALIQRQVINIDYTALSSQETNQREIEPIGLYYYSWHWHLIAWCRLRQQYRDFRLDRITSFTPLNQQFPKHSRLTLQQYLDNKTHQDELEEVEIIFGEKTAHYVQQQKYMFGFIGEEEVDKGIRMRFLTHIPDYMARWLLQFTNDITITKGETVRASLLQLSAELAAHWNP